MLAADGILCGHTHFDHVLDVPAIARFTGAQVFGAESRCATRDMDNGTKG